MILIAQPHTGLPSAEKRLRPVPTTTHPLAGRSRARSTGEQHPLLFIQPSPPPYVLPAPIDRSQPVGTRRRRHRVACHAVNGIVMAVLIGLLGATICLSLYWDSFVDIIHRRKANAEQPPRPDSSLGEILTCEMPWFLSPKNGLPRRKFPGNLEWPRQRIDLNDGGNNGAATQKQLSTNSKNRPLLPFDDDDGFGIYRGSRAYYSAVTSFDLPPLNLGNDEKTVLDSLFVFASGETTSGSIQLITEEQSETDIDGRIRVDLVARFWNVAILSQDTSVCAIRRGKDLGITLMGKKTPNDTQRGLWIDAIITIPVKPGQVLDLDKLTVNTPSFRVAVSLEDKVHFRLTKIQSANAPINIKSLTSTNIDIKTSHFPVKGTMTAQKSAMVATENSPLDVDISVTSSDIHAPAVVQLHTTNNRLSAIIRSTSPDPSYLDIETITSNGRMNVTISDAPFGTRLDYKGKTSNADASIELFHSFAGTLNLEGSKFSNFFYGYTEDPTGQGFKPKVKSPRPSLFEIWYKSEEELNLGHVKLDIQNGAAQGCILSENRSWRPNSDEALP